MTVQTIKLHIRARCMNLSRITSKGSRSLMIQSVVPLQSWDIEMRYALNRTSVVLATCSSQCAGCDAHFHWYNNALTLFFTPYSWLWAMSMSSAPWSSWWICWLGDAERDAALMHQIVHQHAMSWVLNLVMWASHIMLTNEFKLCPTTVDFKPHPSSLLPPSSPSFSTTLHCLYIIY
jgi:hypothetical protein